MWGFLLSYIEELLVSPYRPPPGRSGAAGLIGWGILVLTLTGFVLRRPALALIPIFFSIYVLASIGAAYRCLERARDLPLEDPRELPIPHRYLAFVFPMAAALFTLARALDAMRR